MAARRSTSATRPSSPIPSSASGSARPGPHELREAAVRLQRLRLHSGRPDAIAGRHEQGSGQGVLLLVAGDTCRAIDPGTLQRSNMPTEAERNGDFSQTRFNTAGQARFIRNPFAANPTCSFNTGGAGCFTNNVIPSEHDQSVRQGHVEPAAAAKRRGSERESRVTTTSIRRRRRSSASRTSVASTSISGRARRSTRACRSATKSTIEGIRRRWVQA